jgi:hypothetical protein
VNQVRECVVARLVYGWWSATRCGAWHCVVALLVARGLVAGARTNFVMRPLEARSMASLVSSPSCIATSSSRAPSALRPSYLHKLEYIHSKGMLRRGSVCGWSGALVRCKWAWGGRCSYVWQVRSRAVAAWCRCDC